MLELYQAEWCPHSHRIRQLLTEVGQEFVAHQVAADRADRHEMRAAVGSDSIPLLVHDGEVYADEEPIVAHLRASFTERADAEKHRERDREEGPNWRPPA